MTRYALTAHRPYIEHVHDALCRVEGRATIRAAFPSIALGEMRSACIGLLTPAGAMDLMWSEIDGWRLCPPSPRLPEWLDLPVLAGPGFVAAMVQAVIDGEIQALPAPPVVREWVDDPKFEAELDRYTVVLARPSKTTE